MRHSYKVGQYVYTAKDIRGWFDYSTKEYIPANTVCEIIAQGHYDDADDHVYLVKFFGKNKEFGTQYILETSLKLG